MPSDHLRQDHPAKRGEARGAELQAAASTIGSSFCSDVQTGITMKGSITWTRAMTMAVSV